MSELPRGWLETTLGEACEVILGQSPPGSAYNTDRVGVPFFQGKAEFGPLTPTTRKWTTEGNKRARQGDVLVSVRAPVGPTNLAPMECVIGRGLAALRPTDVTTTRFVLYQMRATESRLANVATGSTFAAVSGDQLRRHPFRLPPLPEQRRIVAAIEEQFSRVDAATLLLRSCRDRLRGLRRAVLRAAVDDDWEIRELAEVAQVRLGRQRSPKNHFGPSMRPYLRAANVSWAGLELDDVKQMNFSETELQTYRLLSGDVVVSVASGSRGEVGKAALWRDEIADCCFQNTLLRVRSAGPLPEWLHLVLYEAALSGRLGAAAAGVGIHHLGAERLSRWKVPVPPIGEQRRIVEHIERALSVIDSLATQVGNALTRAGQLRRAVLRVAFAGRLVRRDKFDEPTPELADPSLGGSHTRVPS